MQRSPKALIGAAYVPQTTANRAPGVVADPTIYDPFTKTRPPVNVGTPPVSNPADMTPIFTMPESLPVADPVAGSVQTVTTATVPDTAPAADGSTMSTGLKAWIQQNPLLAALLVSGGIIYGGYTLAK